MHPAVPVARALRPHLRSTPASTHGFPAQEPCCALAPVSCSSSTGCQSSSSATNFHHLRSFFSVRGSCVLPAPSTSRALKCQFSRKAALRLLPTRRRCSCLCTFSQEDEPSYLLGSTACRYPPFCPTSATTVPGTVISLHGRQRKVKGYEDAGLRRFFSSAANSNGGSFASGGPHNITLEDAGQTRKRHGKAVQEEAKGGEGGTAHSGEEKADQKREDEREAGNQITAGTYCAGSKQENCQRQNRPCVPSVSETGEMLGHASTDSSTCAVSPSARTCSSFAGNQDACPPSLVSGADGSSQVTRTEVHGSKESKNGRKWASWRICLASLGIGMAGAAACLIVDCGMFRALCCQASFTPRIEAEPQQLQPRNRAKAKRITSIFMP